MASPFKTCGCGIALNIQTIQGLSSKNFEIKTGWNQENFKTGMGLSDKDFLRLKKEFEEVLRLKIKEHPRRLSSLRECVFTRPEDTSWRDLVIQQFRNEHARLFADHPYQIWLIRQFSLWVTSIKHKKEAPPKKTTPHPGIPSTQLPTPIQLPTPVQVPSSVQLPALVTLSKYIDLENPGWKDRLPQSIGLTCFTSLSKDLNPEISMLWEDHLPKILSEPNPMSELDLYAEVLTKIWNNPVIWSEVGAQLYRNGVQVGNVQISKETADSSTLMGPPKQDVAKALYQAITPTQSNPIYSILNIWMDVDARSDISITPPQSIESRYTVCDPVNPRSESRVGINVTPTGTFIDLHYDHGQAGLSKTFGNCNKVWLLFPPTMKNLQIYVSSIGFSNHLARVGAQLEGGIILQTSSLDALHLPPGTLHTVFTVAGGFLSGINYSIVEGLPIMSRLLIAQQPVRNHNIKLASADFEKYSDALRQGLGTELPTLLSYALSSWMTFIQVLQNINPKQQHNKYLQSIVSISTEVLDYLDNHPGLYPCPQCQNNLHDHHHLKEHSHLETYENCLRELKEVERQEAENREITMSQERKKKGHGQKRRRPEDLY